MMPHNSIAPSLKNVSGSTASDHFDDRKPVTLRYAVWEKFQLPGYQLCAERFNIIYPHIQIVFELVDWDHYWHKLDGDFLLRNPPDIFVNHISKYPSFIKRDLMLDLQDYVKRDNFDVSIYQQCLAENWVFNGHRYALPKDWDTVAIVYNVDMFRTAGIDPAITRNWTWNIEDTGTFNKSIARLTIDINGNNGLSQTFNKNKVVQYGFIISEGNSAAGQVSWSSFAMSNGAEPLLDKFLGTRYTYDDPRRIEAIQWYADLHAVKNFAPNMDTRPGLENSAFIKGQGAMILDGSWRINQYITECKFNVGFAMLPIGPKGRKTIMNGLGDSIWKGTRYPEEAWQWVRFLGSVEAQDIIAEMGLVFPSVKSSTEKTLKKWNSKGIDVSVYVKEAQNENETFQYPMSNNSFEVQTIAVPTLNFIMVGVTKAGPALKGVNERISKLFATQNDTST